MAWEAALRGKRVVVVDFDLEAPGIPSLIPFRKPIEQAALLVDKDGKSELFGEIFARYLAEREKGIR